MISSKWIVFLGPPGCGKGTQSEYLIAKDKFVIITVGDILRNGQEKFVHEFGKTVGEIISSGALLPDTVVSDLVRDRLQEIESAEKKNILF
ncbi:MAG: nucleoside monophosphate kinase, partial [Holosporales bacterium]|nr:nucleoside monophosphate kinase [Holosporales bacterium]